MSSRGLLPLSTLPLANTTTTPTIPSQYEALIKEIQSLRAEVTRLRQENALLRQQQHSQSQPPPLPPHEPNLDPTTVPTQTPPVKRKALSPEEGYDKSDKISPHLAQALETQRQEYLNLHQTIVATQTAMQDSITALHTELLTCMKELLPSKFAPSVSDPTHFAPLPDDDDLEEDI